MTTSMENPIKGKITFRLAAVLFILSATFELTGLMAPVVLFGAMRSGIAALGYHLIYVGLYAALGVGLWRATSWAYRLVFITTSIYTLDKIHFVVFREAILASLMRQFGRYPELQDLIAPQMVLQALTWVALLFAAGWWGFAAYTYWRRDYFRQAPSPPLSSP